jgi:DNA integrity scanning protein DisA with diadenylate cyclase activity
MMRWQGAVDFLVLAVALYLVLLRGREARALRAFVAILALRAGALVGRRFDLPITEWVLDTASLLALVLLLVVFQGELRRAFTSLEAVLRPLWPGAGVAAAALHAVGEATFALAAAKRGALIVVGRADPLETLLAGGVPLGGEVSAEILEAIFRKVSPVHDGAAVIVGGRISRVGAVLPLTEREDLPKRCGTRHRAAIGLPERSDALAVAVSEERGTVTLFSGLEAREFERPEELVRELERLAGPAKPRASSPLRRAVTADLGLRASAVGLALLIWGTLWLGSGTAVRTVIVPVELSHVRDGLTVSRLSAATVEVRLRGSAWVIESIATTRLVARLDLGDRGEGTHDVAVDPRALNLPSGLTIEGLSPERVRIDLTASSTNGRPREGREAATP